jgi:hypothetical protein
MASGILYQAQELAFRTQYAELKERTGSADALLPGTPGTLVKRQGTGYAYWYRVYYPLPGRQAEQMVGREDDVEAHDGMLRRIEFAQWVAAQVRDLRKLQFQVADKGVASVLVELHNRRILSAGVTLVGTLCYMAWLNELGAKAVAARTQDIDLAARQTLKLAVPESFLAAMDATQLDFSPVPGMPSQAPSTSVKQKGREGLRVDVLTHGDRMGKTVPVPQLSWHAQTMPHYAYLLDDPRQAAMLAGGHCIPLMLPRPERFVWHKLYSSASRQSFREKAQKDLMQAATLAAILVEQHDEALSDTFEEAPASLREAAKKRLPALRRALAAHPQTLEQFESVLG